MPLSISVTSTPATRSTDVAGRQQRAADRACGVEEVDGDRRGGARHAVDAGRRRRSAPARPASRSSSSAIVPVLTVRTRTRVCGSPAPRPGRARWRRGRRRRGCCRSWAWCRPSACRCRPGRTGSRRRSRARVERDTIGDLAGQRDARRRARRPGAGRASPSAPAAARSRAAGSAGRSSREEIGALRGAAPHQHAANRGLHRRLPAPPSRCRRDDHLRPGVPPVKPRRQPETSFL